jgi:hypothetical protein
MNPGIWLCTTVSSLTICQRGEVRTRSERGSSPTLAEYFLTLVRAALVGGDRLSCLEASCSHGRAQARDLGGGRLDQWRPQASHVTPKQLEASLDQDAALGREDSGVNRQQLLMEAQRRRDIAGQICLDQLAGPEGAEVR